MSALVETFGLVRDGSDEKGYLEAEDEGLTLFYRAGRVEAVLLHAEGKDGFSAYRGALPFGLAFAAKAPEVRRAVGEPDRSSGPIITAPEIRWNGWDRYDYDGFYLHFTYRVVVGTIEMVAFGAIDDS